MSFRWWILWGFIAVILGSCAVKVPRTEIAESSPTASSPASTPLSQLSSSPATVNTSGVKVVKSGRFASGEHPTEGEVRLVTQNGSSFLELDQGFKTSSLGPDLVVILHRSTDVLGSTQPPAYPLNQEDYVFLAPLKQFTGSQKYPIPANINLESYQSAVIWCRKFNATFGAARLQ